MRKLALVLSLALIVLSAPTCEFSVNYAISRMPPEDIEANKFNWVVLRWMIPGAILLLSGVTSAFMVLIIVGSRVVHRARFQIGVALAIPGALFLGVALTMVLAHGMEWRILIFLLPGLAALMVGLSQAQRAAS